jgi:PEGA domain-containing protein
MKLVRCCALLAIFSAPLLAQNGSGSLVVKADPGRAGVFVDGQYYGPAANFRIARTYNLPAGEHEIRLADPRYQEAVAKVTIERGKKTVLRQKLAPLSLAQPPFGRLRTISEDKFAAVYVNGHFCGHADEFSNTSQALLLNPGHYEVKIEPHNALPVVAQVVIETDKIVIVR